MEFKEDYFCDEYREGFLVKSMMKRTWAAEIEVLEVIADICKRHGLTWYADSGTLLGAVRHQGFIPWDDDIDICMKRKDYQKFWEIARNELPEGFAVLNVYTEAECENLLTRIVNSKEISFQKEHLKKFHGCPYVVGIDIVPLDAISPNEDEKELQCSLIKTVLETVQLLDSEFVSEKDKEKLVSQIEELCGTRFTRDKGIKNQMYQLGDLLCSLYAEEETEMFTIMVEYVNNRKITFPKKCYETIIEMPFESIAVPVPAGYERILLNKYGVKSMTPRQDLRFHDYPFYRGQEELIQSRFGRTSEELINQ